jgi:branched-chain amino acid transport system ATP-binding protein
LPLPVVAVPDHETGGLSGPPILETVGLCKRFGAVDAVASVDFRLRPGELRCLIGPNGAGKSTFFRMLTAQIKPSAGRILFGGNDITGLSVHRISRLGIGIKNQVPDLYDNLSARESIWLSARFRHDRRQACSVTEAVIEQFGLKAIATSRVGELSHGQRQWIEFGMIMALEPKLILLDEPTAGLAQRESEAFVPLLHSVSSQLDCSILIIEHDMPVILGVADRIYCLELGQVIAEGTPAEIRTDRRVIDSYLGTSDGVASQRSGVLQAKAALVADQLVEHADGGD